MLRANHSEPPSAAAGIDRLVEPYAARQRGSKMAAGWVMRWLGDCLIVGLLVLTACTQSHMVTQTYCLAPRSDLDGKLPLLDQDYQCKYGFKVGSDLEFTVNSRTNTVLEHVVRNDGSSSRQTFSLVAARSWMTLTGSVAGQGGFVPSIPILTVNGMINRCNYYESVTGGGDSADIYWSSLSGIAGMLYRVNLISDTSATVLQAKLFRLVS